MAAWIDTRDDVDWIPSTAGVNAFVRLKDVPDTAAFARRLFEERDVAVAEGELFDRPGWLRLSAGATRETVAEGLKRLGEALDAARA
jgi:aspartate/methionine/tyrosine aminotransferase